MMGTCRPRRPSDRRIARVVSTPSIPGICTSIRMRSTRPWRSAPRAAAPLSTAVTVCPRRASTIWASLRLTELSSTSSTASLRVRAGSRAGWATAGAPRGGGIHLLERRKDRRLLLGRDADTGVAHREMATELVPRSGLRPDPHRDHTLLRELDGITHQVQHDLPEPQRIAEKRVRRLRRDLPREIEPLGAA